MADIPLEFDELGTTILPGNRSDDHVANFADILGSVLGIIMTVALLILLFMLITGALSWITAGGDSSKLTAARERITNALIGILILSGSVALFLYVQWLLGLEIITLV